MKIFQPGQRVKIVGAESIKSKFGIIIKPCFFGGYYVKVSCKYDRDHSLLFMYAEVDGTRPVLIDDSHLQPVA